MPATQLEERHGKMIERLKAVILKEAQDAADSARRASFDRVDAENAGRKMAVKARSDVRAMCKAHLALVAYAEQANPDGWPVPDEVHRFSRLYRVPRAQLGALVGLLSRT